MLPKKDEKAEVKQIISLLEQYIHSMSYPVYYPTTPELDAVVIGEG